MKFIFTLILFIATNSFALLGYGTKDVSGTSYILTNLGDVKRAAAKKVYLLPFASSAEIEKEYKSKWGAVFLSLLEEHRGKICKNFDQQKKERINGLEPRFKNEYRVDCISEKNQLAETKGKVDPKYLALMKERELLTSKLTKLSDEYEVLMKLAQQIAEEKEVEIFDREFSKIKVIEEHHEDGYQRVFINNSKLGLSSTYEASLFFNVRPMVDDRLIQDNFVPKYMGKGYDYGKKRVYIFPPNSKIRSDIKSYSGYEFESSLFRDEARLDSYIKSDPDVKTCTAVLAGTYSLFKSRIKREVPCITGWEIDKSRVRFGGLNIDESTGRLNSFEPDAFKKFAIEEVKENDSRLKAIKKISQEIKQVKASIVSVDKKLQPITFKNEKLIALTKEEKEKLNICQKSVQRRVNLESLSCPKGNDKKLITALNNFLYKVENSYQIYLDKFDGDDSRVWEKFVKDSATQETSTNVNGEFVFKDADEDSMIYSDFKFKDDLATASRYWLVKVPKDSNYIELHDENTSAFVKDIFSSAEYEEDISGRKARRINNWYESILNGVDIRK